MLRDLFSWGAVSYHVVILEGETRFLRIRGHVCQELLRHKHHDTGVGAVVQSVGQIAEHPGYYGQPISVLVDNMFSYVVTARLNESTAKRDIDDLRSLVPDRLEPCFTILDGSKGKVLVCTGLDKDFVRRLRVEFEQQLIPAKSIAPVAVQLIGELAHSKVAGPCLRIMAWGGDLHSYAGISKEGLPFVGSLQRENDSTANVATADSLKLILFGADAQIVPVIYSSVSRRTSAAVPHRSLGRLLSSTVPKPLRSMLTHAVTQPRLANGMYMVQNSVKLLTHTLAVVIFLCAIGVAAIALVSNDPGNLEKYQELYTSKAALQTQSDSLRTVNDHLTHAAVPLDDPASLLSTCCQVSTPSVAFAALGVKNFGRDSTILEGVGQARNSGAIFQYVKNANAVISPCQLAITSFQPEVVMSNNHPDTTLRFKLGMTVHHGH